MQNTWNERNGPIQDTRFQCSGCGKMLKNKFTMNMHVKYSCRNANPRLWRCLICEFETKYKQSLEKHVATKHAITPSCPWK